MQGSTETSCPGIKKDLLKLVKYLALNPHIISTRTWEGLT